MGLAVRTLTVLLTVLSVTVLGLLVVLRSAVLLVLGGSQLLAVERLALRVGRPLVSVSGAVQPERRALMR